MAKALEKFLLKRSATISEAINLLDRVGGLICIVVDDDDRAVGTITDGDVRRAILKNISLDSHVDAIMTANFVSVNKGTTRANSLRLMQQMKLNCIPVLYSNGKHLEIQISDHLEPAQHFQITQY